MMNLDSNLGYRYIHSVERAVGRDYRSCKNEWELDCTRWCVLDLRREMVAEMFDTCYVGPNPSNPP
jgi:hypothetical protein